MRPDPRTRSARAEAQGLQDPRGRRGPRRRHPRRGRRAPQGRLLGERLPLEPLNEQMSHQGKYVVGLLTQGTMGGTHSREVAYYEWARVKLFVIPLAVNTGDDNCGNPPPGTLCNRQALYPELANIQFGTPVESEPQSSQCTSGSDVHCIWVRRYAARDVAGERLADQEADRLDPRSASRAAVYVKDVETGQPLAGTNACVKSVSLDADTVVRPSPRLQRDALVARAADATSVTARHPHHRDARRTDRRRRRSSRSRCCSRSSCSRCSSTRRRTCTATSPTTGASGSRCSAATSRARARSVTCSRTTAASTRSAWRTGSHWLGVSFDGFLSVVSWFSTLALPLVFLWLGRHIWPGRWFEPALLVVPRHDRQLARVRQPAHLGEERAAVRREPLAAVPARRRARPRDRHASPSTIGGRSLKRAAIDRRDPRGDGLRARAARGVRHRDRRPPTGSGARGASS